MSDRPLIFLDVDGVLNRFALPPLGQRDTFFFRDIPVAGWSFNILFDRRDTERLARLADYGDLAWGTTWEHDAHKITDVLGVDSSSWPIAVRNAREHEYFKAPGILRIAGRRPFVWLDDEISDYDHTTFANAGATWLGIDVEPKAGLTDEHVDQAIAWITALGTTP